MKPEQNESQQLDRRVPLAFHLVGEIVRGLGDGIKDYPVVSGAVILGQALAFGVELNALARGIPIEAQPSFILHLAAFVISAGAGIIGEVGYRLMRSIVRMEKEYENEQLSDDPSVGDIQDIVNPDEL